MVFKFADYKAYIRARIQDSEQSWGLISKLADAAGCQRSYLSRALNAEVHLLPDHLLALCEYWQLSDRETEYLLSLLEKDRASSARLRQRLQAKLKRLREEENELQNRVKRSPAPAGEREMVYYSSWHFSALHIIVSIPKFQTAEAISAHLQLPLPLVQEGLEQLHSFGFIHKEKSRWTFANSEMHVTRDSPLVSLHHANWRQRAILSSQKRDTKNIHFSVVQAVDEDAWEKIRGQVLALIEEASATAAPAPSEKLVCLNCDFFTV